MSDEIASLEVLQPSAVEALERAQIDVQISTAHRFPRSLEVFKKRAFSMATLDEETAESCIYSRPVGKEKNDKGQWVEKFAEGSSVRLAEIVAACYGNIRVSARIIEQTERFVKCEGIAHDLETNYAGKSEVMEVTVKQDGTPYSERQRALIAKVALSKAYRDAIFKVVPKALCKTAYDGAKSICMGTGKTIEQRQERVRAWLTSIRISDERVFLALQVKGWSEVNDEKLLTLTGLKTSIADGDVKVEEAFPPIAKAPAETAPPASATAAAIDGAAASKPAPIADPFKAVLELCKKDGVTENQVLTAAKKKKLCEEKAVEIVQISDSSLTAIVHTWAEFVKSARAVKE